ncbi:uncharacterized protein LOC126886472 isoform X2 [Diabrotica virgifera virgifera]|uniref:Methyltransferase NSUN7 n=1 Tax=Diabrotica virgifera virgifera TaxID=50390 RepID=A0ABM5KGQ7_DIAVI|nr:uncharacterized protein LOC126886472 isoform X2 [Diabrotica virgifera virgifera]
MGETTDHTLWVNLSSLGDGNVFAVLPRLMEQMFSDNLIDDIEDFTDVILPSDATWQAKIYYQLVEKQRQNDEFEVEYDEENEVTMYDPVFVEEKPKLHEWNILPPRVKTVECDLKVDKYIRKHQTKKGPSAITWTVSDIAKAGCLLSQPPLQTDFEDEQEMRRVYTLIYDVFRYKNVLTQALNDVRFFETFPKLSENIPIVWLLMYDLYHRSFNKRETTIAALARELFDAYGLTFTENALWTQKIKLAAAVARLRIKNNALSLSELLPLHLRDEKVTEQAQHNPVTCWINICKIKDNQSLCDDIEKTFSLKMVSDVTRLDKHTFKWDRHCPQIIVFHASMRTQLAKSHFVKNHIFVVQDKSFCLGPATFKKLVTDLELTGSVIQTHINSPRTTAYLATLLAQNEKIKKLIAFSAGKRKDEYESYFNELGMSNIRLFSDRLIDTPADANYMEEVVAVFATPPNSYSAVLDPIDLVCSRGGDLSMLEILTETGDSKEAKERVSGILEEQQKTLRFAMSRPQIQFVLYETHSELEAENTQMVDKTLTEINKIAKMQHAMLQGQQTKNILPPSDDKEMKEINNNENLQKPPEEQGDLSSKTPTDIVLPEGTTPESAESFLEKVTVPDTDIFNNCNLPMLCPSESCKGFQKEVCGCYLALLQRKEIIRLDDKYMIQMAENRGLFGNSNTRAVKTKSVRTIRRKAEKPEKTEVAKKKLKDSEGEDLMTKYCLYKSKLHAFDMRCKDTNFVNMDKGECIILTFEKALSEDECIIKKSELVGKLLKKMNSAQIRQLVCPFNKQFDMFSKIPSLLPNSRPSSRSSSRPSSRPSSRLSSRPSSRKDSSRTQNANINSLKNKSRCRRPASQMENLRNDLCKNENGLPCHLELRCRRPVSQMEHGRNNLFENENEEEYKNKISTSKSTGELRRK